jgi:hypothetical protein
LYVLATQSVLAGRDAYDSLEVSIEMALVKKACMGCGLWNRPALAQQPLGARHAHERLKLVWRHTKLCGKKPIEMEGTQGSHLRQIIQRDVLRVMLYQIVTGTAQAAPFCNG